MNEHKAADFTDAPKRQHVSDAAWEVIEQRDPGVPRETAERNYAECRLMLITVDEWCRLQSEIADRDEWLDELEARYRSALARLRTLTQSQDAQTEPSTGALLLRARVEDRRLGLGDAGKVR